MTLFFDTTALLALHIDESFASVISEAMELDPVWCASSIALTEAMAAINQLSDDEIVREDLEDNIRRTWDYMYVVPVDQACLDRAAFLAREQPIRIADALHLAAADRLPKPTQFITLDAAQIPIALSLGYDIISP